MGHAVGARCLAGASLGAFATTAALQGLGAIGLWCLAWRRWREGLLMAVVMLVAVRVLMVTGGELAPGLSRRMCASTRA